MPRVTCIVPAASSITTVVTVPVLPMMALVLPPPTRLLFVYGRLIGHCVRVGA